MAALLTQVSKPPKRRTAASASASTSSSFATSVGTARAWPPAPSISAASASSAFFERAASTSLAPCRAAMRAVASPMPEDAPVTTMTCSETGFSLTAMT